MNAVESDTPTTLTREELFAAPDDDYMCAAQLAFLRQRLLAKKQALRDAARETTIHQQDNENYPRPD